MIDRTAARIASLVGWRRNGLAFLLGAAATLALPPVGWFPVLYIVFPPLVWLIGGATGRGAAFAAGWSFGFGYFVFGLYWIGNALLVFAAKFAWLLPFASGGLPAALALFCGAAALIAWHGRSHLSRALGLALAWTACEWVRGHALTGFPWNLIGYSWTGSDAMMQLAAGLGIYGLTLAAMVSACLPAALAGPATRWPILALAIALPVATWAGGAVRLANSAAALPVENVGLRIVQGDIPQREKWARAFQERNLRQFLELSTRGRPDWVTHVIWPETAATFFISENPALRPVLATAVPPGGLLLAGAPRRGAQGGTVSNAMIAFDETGRTVGTYDKFHLVPFGEYVPFADILPIEKITQGNTGFTPGPGLRTLRLPGLPAVGPLICYEVIFPGAVALKSDRPAWLLNVTNDAWYGISAGPHQHLAQARVRAVEEGLPLVRAAYSGISAMVDPYGRVLKKRGLRRAGVIDARLPQALAEAPPYAKWGDYPLFALSVSIFVILLLLPRNFLQPKEQR